jgi:CRISPR-associated protein Cmr5
MPKPETVEKPLLRDQYRALHAYEAVASVPPAHRADYKIAVNDLGATILRNGLCAALAAIQRRGSGRELLFDHLASASVPGLEGTTASELARRVHTLDTDSYMIATREMLATAVWLKRAVQATFEG